MNKEIKLINFIIYSYCILFYVYKYLIYELEVYMSYDFWGGGGEIFFFFLCID